MNRKKVSELAKQVRGVSYKPEDLHDSLDDNSVILLRANNINDGKINFEDVVYVDKSKVSKEQYLCKGDILICASSGSKQLVGKAASVDFDIECTFGAFCKVVRPNSDIADYLGTYFQSNSYRQKISEVAIGANINNIRNEHIDSLILSVGTNEENSEVVRIMKSVQKVIDGRKQELRKLDELIKARFVEMFEGKQWQSVSAGSIMHSMRNGMSPSNKGTITERVLTLSAITHGQFDATAWKDGLFDECPPKDKRISKSDFYMCRGNGNKDLVGTGVYSSTDMPTLVFPDTVIAASVDEGNICLPFLHYEWKQPAVRRQIEAGARTTNGTYKVNQKVLSGVEIILPPLALQRQFSDFVAQLDKSKFAA